MVKFVLTSRRRVACPRNEFNVVAHTLRYPSSSGFPPSVSRYEIDDLFAGKGGKNRRRGKNENETEKRELVFKEDGQGEIAESAIGSGKCYHLLVSCYVDFSQNTLK